MDDGVEKVIGSNGPGCWVGRRWGRTRCREFWGLLEHKNDGEEFGGEKGVFGECSGRGKAVGEDGGWCGRWSNLKSAKAVSESDCLICETRHNPIRGMQGTITGKYSSQNSIYGMKRKKIVDKDKSKGVLETPPRSNCDHSEGIESAHTSVKLYTWKADLNQKGKLNRKFYWLLIISGLLNTTGATLFQVIKLQREQSLRTTKHNLRSKFSTRGFPPKVQDYIQQWRPTYK